MDTFSPLIQQQLQKLYLFTNQQNFTVSEPKPIQSGVTISVFDSNSKVPVNIYTTGKILVQGKDCPLKELLTRWKDGKIDDTITVAATPAVPNIQEATASSTERRNRYQVHPNKIEPLWQDTIFALEGAMPRVTKGAAELYRAEFRSGKDKVIVTQYKTGTLFVQGRQSPLYDFVCDALDKELDQSFVERVSRYVPTDTFEQTRAYMEKFESENEAVKWIHQKLGKGPFNFLTEPMQKTLLSAAGLYHAAKRLPHLDDYSTIVMPFGKVLEGFITKFAVHVGIAEEKSVEQSADEIKIRKWIKEFRERLPDLTRHSATQEALATAWGARNKAVHWDSEEPFCVLAVFEEAEGEITTILRGMQRAYKVFIEGGVKLKEPSTAVELSADPAPPVEKKIGNEETQFEFGSVNSDILKAQLKQDGYIFSSDTRRQKWSIQQEELKVFAPTKEGNFIYVRGTAANEFVEKYKGYLEPTGQSATEPKSPITSLSYRIGVDESGKGDVFGPLVVAGVAITAEDESYLHSIGVRDSKTLRADHIAKLAEAIKQKVPHHILVLLPQTYNTRFKAIGNLNVLLAECHAEIISTLVNQTGATQALSDQFGKPELIENALKKARVSVALTQRPRAEEDIAVAAASILARAVFVEKIQEYSERLSRTVPRGASAPEIKELLRFVGEKWGRKGLWAIAKYHFAPVQEIAQEVPHE